MSTLRQRFEEYMTDEYHLRQHDLELIEEGKPGAGQYRQSFVRDAFKIWSAAVNSLELVRYNPTILIQSYTSGVGGASGGNGMATGICGYGGGGAGGSDSAVSVSYGALKAGAVGSGGGGTGLNEMWATTERPY
jgi:hypothetical protein